MASHDHGGEDDGAEADAEDAVDQVAAEEAADHVGPAVQRVELREDGRVDVEVLDEVVL